MRVRHCITLLPAAAALVALGACADSPTTPAARPPEDAAASKAARVTMTALPIPGALGASAEAINNAGDIVGTASLADGSSLSFLWRNGELTDLGSFEPLAINSQGQIVGFVLYPDQHRRAFLWEDGTLTEIPTLGGTSNEARDINSAGQVVGYSETGSGARHAFLWDHGTLTDLGVPNDPNHPGFGTSEAVAINAAGDIVGSGSTGFDYQHALLWRHGEMIDLGVLPGARSSFATDISPSGEIVGWSEILVSSYLPRAFVWRDGVMTDLGVLPGHNYSIANAISPSGDIVGVSRGDVGRAHAVLWQKGAIIDLDPDSPPNNSSIANDINPGGRIVGRAAGGAVIWTVK